MRPAPKSPARPEGDEPSRVQPRDKRRPAPANASPAPSAKNPQRR